MSSETLSSCWPDDGLLDAIPRTAPSGFEPKRCVGNDLASEEGLGQTEEEGGLRRACAPTRSMSSLWTA